MPLTEISIDTIYKQDKMIEKYDVKAILDWMEKQPHLPKVTELQISLFLHSCFYSIEAAKTAIDTYFTVKTLYPDLFGSRTFSDSILKATTNTYLFTPLPKPSPSGDTILLSKLLDGNSATFNATGQFKLMDVIISLYLHQNGPLYGVQLIFDMQLSTFGHLLKVSPVVVKKFAYYLEEAMPIRLKRVHFINIVPIIDKIFALVKPLIKKELFDLFVIHNDIKTLYEYIPQELLPEDYGGSCESTSKLQEKMKAQIENGEDLLKLQENQLVNESKRQGPSKYAENLFGVEGSFKKLEID